MIVRVTLVLVSIFFQGKTELTMQIYFASFLILALFSVFGKSLHLS